MSKTLTPFEKSLKDKMSVHEASYEHQDWMDLQNRLRDVSIGSGRANLVAVAATVAVLIAGAAVYYKVQVNSAKANLASDSVRLIDMPSASSQSSDSTIDSSSDSVVILNSGSSNSQSSNIIVQNNKNDKKLIENSVSVDSGAHVNITKPGTTEVNKNSASLGFSASSSETCQGTEVEFGVTNGPKEGSYLWNFGDGHFSSQVNPKHKYAKPGTYDVSLSITSDAGQINTTVMPDMITVRPAPTANFKWEFVNDNPDMPQLKILNNSDHASSYQWKFFDGTSSREVSPILSISKKGKQNVSLQVVNEYGCTDATIKTIHVNTDFNIGAASSFNPGEEVFMPSGLKDNKVRFELSIYDAQGNKVFETTSRSKGWDGKLADGSFAPKGNKYSWKIIMTNDNNKEERYFNGIVTINP